MEQSGLNEIDSAARSAGDDQQSAEAETSAGVTGAGPASQDETVLMIAPEAWASVTAGASGDGAASVETSDRDAPRRPASRSRRRRPGGSRAEDQDEERAASAAAPVVERPPLFVAPVAFFTTPEPERRPQRSADRIDVPVPETERESRGGRARPRTRRTTVVHKQRGHEEDEAPQRLHEVSQATTPTADHREILVNVDVRETRIALIENQRLVELKLERVERVVGNVYKGRVVNVLPGMDAAFVDIGLERNAFLYVGDILYEDNRDPDTEEEHVRRTSRDADIRSLVRSGQEVLVQIIKGPRGTKGARVSTRVSLPGRYLVLLPESESIGVSRKVGTQAERDRLKKLADEIRPQGCGLIIRTEAEGHTDDELREDMEHLHTIWRRIQSRADGAPAPAVIHKDLGPVLKTIRDLFGVDVDRLVIDSREGYEEIVSVLSDGAPELVERIFLHEERTPLFQRYNLEEEIDRLLRRKVWLPNGAYLLIDTTEALTTIDVNTGKFVGTSSLSQTILRTNLDAVHEIGRQLRLRDIGGMIVLDFIDMNSSRDRQSVQRALDLAFQRDRTRTKISHISPLGLVEMTRKRTSESVTDVMSHACPYCTGRGKIWSPETVAIRVEREVLKLCAKTDVDAVLVFANPEIVGWLIGQEGEAVERLERMIRRPVYIRGRMDMHHEKYEVHPAEMQEMERELMPYHGGQIVECRVDALDLITAPRSAAWVDGYLVDLANAVKHQGQVIRARLTEVRRSFALGEPLPRESGP